MKKMAIFATVFALLLGTALATATSPALVESLEYKGFGVLAVEFWEDGNWVSESTFTITDAQGAPLEYTVLGGDEDDCYLMISALMDGSEYTFGYAAQNISFVALADREYRVDRQGNVRIEYETDPCDYCGKTDHDDDFCPSRPASSRGDDDDRYDRCDLCGETGHDDDDCPSRPASSRGDDDDRYDHDDDDDDDRYDRDDDDDDDD